MALAPATTLGARATGLTRMGATKKGFSRGPSRPSGRSPHTSKRGICFAKASLFEQLYKRHLSTGSAAGAGSPVRSWSTACSVLEGSEGTWSLMGSLRPVKAHIGREWRWSGVMRCRMNSLSTIGTVTPASSSSANLDQTRASRRSTSFTCPRTELGSAGARGS